MSELATLARPYAQAIFELAVKYNAIDRWQVMLSFLSEASRDKYFSKMLSGLVAPENLAQQFILVCGQYIDAYAKNLIRIMAENSRLQVLPYVLKQFVILRYEYESIVKVEIISIDELTKTQLFKIKSVMEKRLSCKVELDCQIDRSILGGIVIRFGQMVIDGSMSNRLCLLADALQS